MLSVDFSDLGKEAIYEIVDLLLSNKTDIERGLRIREADLFSRPHQVFLYDLTNTYFEGSVKKNELAHRGKPKEKRTDCPLGILALVVMITNFPF